MAWDQLSINKPHLVYIILGGFTSIFMLVSLVIKEKFYIGEATVATLCGIIFGPHAANLINPLSWGNTDQITLEFSRIVLVVQCFAVGVELPKAYMERHWRSVIFLLVPVMTFGWLITSLFVWWLIPPLSWLESLCVAACVTATDPVLASSVVGKGKFAKRVPKHLRDLLSAESGCNDGMAFPFVYLALYLIHYKLNAHDVTYHWICITILYECVFGAVYGVLVGYIGRHAIKLAEKKGLIDRESFLVFYFVLALFCAGSGSLLGMDDLLIGFAAGVGFSNDGWFTEKTEESHVSNVIDLLINLTYFVYFGTIIPWDQYNAPAYGLEPWRLVVIAILVIFFRRIPAMMALKPFIPDIKTWREALFAGHFGPIGVGAIFVAILARAELETSGTTPLAVLPSPDSADYVLIYTVWPIVTFLVIASIVVHGSSIAVFTLGKRINTLTITLSYTQDNDRSSAWMNRLPRISSQSRSMSRMSDDSFLEKMDLPPGHLPPIGIPKLALRRQKEEDDVKPGSRSSSLRPYRRRKKRNHDAGGPISQSAIMPARLSEQEHGRSSEPALAHQESGSDTLAEKSGGPSPEERSHSADALDLEKMKSDESVKDEERMKRREETEEGKRTPPSGSDDSPAEIEAYEEGHHLILEDEEGNVLHTIETGGRTDEEKARIIEETRKELSADRSGSFAKHKHESHRKNEGEEAEQEIRDAVEHPHRGLRKALDSWKGFGKARKSDDADPSTEPKRPERRRGPAHAYQFGNTIIVEDEDGEVIKKYTLPGSEGEGSRRFTYTNEQVRHGLHRMGTWVGIGKQAEHAAAEASGIAPETLQKHEQDLSEDQPADKKGMSALAKQKSRTQDQDDAISDDDGLRLTISRAERYGWRGLQKHEHGGGHGDGMIGIGGRRMSTKDFIRQMQQLDPKAKVQKVEESDAPESLKRDVRYAAKREAMAESRPEIKRFETSPGNQLGTHGGKADLTDDDNGRIGRRPDARRAQSDMPSKRPQPKRSNTAESMSSIEENVPTHDTRSTIARHGQGLTAAEMRRKRLSMTNQENRIAEGDEGNHEDDDQQETAAERRRRLAALGIGERESDSDTSDEEGPRQPPQTAVQEPDYEQEQPRQIPRPRIQWGGERGREEPRRDDSESDVGETTGHRVGKKIKNFLNR